MPSFGWERGNVSGDDMLEKPVMFGVCRDLGDDAIDGNGHSGRVEEVTGVGVEHRDAALGMVEGNRVFLSDLEVAERKVAEFQHLGGHLIGGGGRARDIRLRNDQAGFACIQVAFESDIISKFPIMEDHSREVFGREQLAGKNADNRERGQHLIVEFRAHSRFPWMSGLPPMSARGIESHRVFAM